MKVLSIVPLTGAGRTIARFDIQFTPACRLYGLRLVEMDDGRRLTYAPTAQGHRLATFTKEMADTITRAAGAALGEGTAPNDRHTD